MMQSQATGRLRIDLAYDGTLFHGWAKQPGLRTVQSELETALGTLLRRADISLTVGGRTDAGVHARGQVCHLDLLEQDPLEKVTPRRLNGVLRRIGATDVVVKNIKIVSREFDARFSAVSRRYEYRILPGGVSLDPLSRFFTVEHREPLALEAMNEAAQNLLGLRDFATFCKPRDGATTTRTLEEFAWVIANDGAFVGRIKADAFCHSMVRALVGAVVAVGSGRFSLQQFMELAEAKKRTSHIRVMPAHGLSLEEIIYPDSSEYGARAEVTRAKRNTA